MQAANSCARSLEWQADHGGSQLSEEASWFGLVEKFPNDDIQT